MGSQLVKIRDGAVDYGRIYEQKTAALLSIRCALDVNIDDFWIISNVDGFEAFDDIILLVKFKDGSKKMFCIQLKHLEKNVLQATRLESDKGGFSIEKYYDSYKKITKNISKIDLLKGIDINQIYLILYTNAPLTGTNKSVSIKLETKAGAELVDTSTKSNSVWQISSSKKPLEENFLQQFYLYVNQASATALDKLIKNEFDIHFKDVSNAVITTIADYFLKWSVGRKGKIALISKKNVQIQLLEFLLQPYIIEPKQVVKKEDDILNLLNDTLISFNVTAVSYDKSLENVFSSIKYTLEKICDIGLNPDLSWHSNLTDQLRQSLFSSERQEKQQIINVLKEKQHVVAHLTIKDLYLSAWQCKLIPLIINCSDSLNSVQEVLVKFKDITDELSFVLLNPSNIGYIKENLKVFNNISDINDSNLLERNLESTSISLQGKQSVKLKQFSSEILEEVTPDVYMVLLNGVLQVGETIEPEKYYIKRSLKRPHLLLDVVDKNTAPKETRSQQDQEGDLFLLVDFDGVIPVRYINHAIDITAYFTQLVSGKAIDAQKCILTVALSHNDKNIVELATALHIHTRKAVHVVKLSAASLEWFFSKGSVESLQEYTIESTLEDGSSPLVPEDNILQYFNPKINIISNNAGIGKTFMLKSVANKFDSTKWVSYVNLSEHFSTISKKSELYECIEYFFGYQTNVNETVVRDFCKKIYQTCWKENNVVWLLDGYDEVTSVEILWLLNQIKQQGVNTWITTRPTYKQELEMLMDTLSSEITHFREEDHVMFLWKYFETFHHIYGYNHEQIQYIINTINNCSKNLDKTFIAIPLQTRMFAEIFGDDINQVSEKETLTIVDLYNKFVDIKLKEYKSYEATSLKKTLSKLALKLFFTEEQLDELFDFEELAEEALTFQESYKKDSIVIGLNKNGDAVFGHRTFAEFLAGHWLAKQIITRKGEYNTAWVPLVEKLFYVEMIPVRVFFDRILSQDMPLHLAVLNNDVDNIERLLKDEVVANKLDKLGRSPVHLAVSYGLYYDLHVSKKVKGLKRVEMHSVIEESDNNYEIRTPRMDENQFRVSEDILEKLLDHGFLNTTDGLFQYDAFDYAMKSYSLGAVNALYKKFEKDRLFFDPAINFTIFLYCVVYDNLHHILSKRKVYNFDVKESQNEFRNMFKEDDYKLLKMKYNGFYLTEVAAYTGGRESIFELLQSGVLNVQNGIPVHRACFNGQSDVVDMLFKMGADIEITDTDYWGNPIYQAGRRGRSDITYHFIKNSQFMTSKSNKPNLMTPLHYASQGGHLGCVQKLIELGASINQVDQFDNTPLMYAGLYGHINVVEYLLKHLSKEQFEDKNVQSLINVAASKGYSILKLVECGLNVNNTDGEGDTPLIQASKNGYPNVIRELASKNCDLNLMNTNESVSSILKWTQANGPVSFSMKLVKVGTRNDKQRHGGVSALHFAARHGQANCVKELVASGADKDIQDTLPEMGYSPLVWASMYGHSTVTEALLFVKNCENTQKFREDVEIAIIWAAMLNNAKCIQILLEFTQESDQDEDSDRHQERIKTILSSEFGVEFNPAVRSFGEINNIPMVLAAKNGSAQVIQELGSKRYKNNIDLNVALRWAAQEGHVACVKTLVDLGADENVKNEKRLRLLPIVWASMYGRTEVVRYFLSNKSKEYLKNKDLHVALNWASLGGHYECVKMLLDFGLDVNNVDDELNGNTPLISACEFRGTAEVIDKLISSGCTVNKKNSDGMSALDFAAKKKNFDLVKRLVCSEAFENVDIDKNSDLYKNLQLALTWATSKEENELIYKLVDLGIKVSEDDKNEE